MSQYREDSKIITYEFEYDIHKNYTKILELSELDDDPDYPLELDLIVDYEYYYDRGRTYGIPENCYPSEFEMHIGRITIEHNGVDITELIEDNDINKIEDIIYDKIRWE